MNMSGKGGLEKRFQILEKDLDRQRDSFSLLNSLVCDIGNEVLFQGGKGLDPDRSGTLRWAKLKLQKAKTEAEKKLLNEFISELSKK